MLTNVKIENFQGHLNSELTLGPGINVITGPSHKGKSSIIRAIRLALTNQPGGYGFKPTFSEDKDLTKISVVVDGKTIVREKNNSNNRYRLDKEKFENIGTKVPPKILNLLDIADHNIQNQLSPYFLLQNTAGEVAKKLNKVCNLTDIGIILDKIATKVSSAKTDKDHHIVKIEKLEEDLKPFSILEDLKPVVENIGENEKIKNILEAEIDTLASYICDAERLTLSIENIDKNLVSLEKIYEQIKINTAEFSKKDEEIKQLTTIIYKIENINIDEYDDFINRESDIVELKELALSCDEKNNTITKLNNLIIQITNINIDEYDALINEETRIMKMGKLASQAILLESQISKLESVVSKYTTYCEEIEEKQKSLMVAENQHQELCDSMDVCVLCGTDLSGKGVNL